MIYHIAYTSAAPEPVTPDQMAQVLQVSVHNNTRRGITGILLYHDQCFFQVLEGDKDAVERSYARIKADSRHIGVLRLWHQMAEERAFAFWAMGYAGPDLFDPVRTPAHDQLRHYLRQPAGGPQGAPVTLALARQMYKRFRFDCRPYAGPVLI